MLSKNGEVKVVDFGLAKADSQLENTDEGVVKGKFSYLSPEAALGRGRSTRAPTCSRSASSRGRCSRTAGCSSARAVRDGADACATRGSRRCRRLNPNCRPELDAIVRKALARDRDERFQTAAEYGDALADFMFANELKATSRDVAAAVRAGEGDRERTANPKESLIHALVQDELARMMSIDRGRDDREAGRADARQGARRHDRLDEEPPGRLTCGNLTPGCRASPRINRGMKCPVRKFSRSSQSPWPGWSASSG